MAAPAAAAPGRPRPERSSGVLGIPHYVLDCRQQFHDAVLRHTWQEYSRGRTPNPCIICNERIKFGFLLDAARSLGARKIATGHYARKETDRNGGIFLRRGLDPGKDQSYFLFSLDDHSWRQRFFPWEH